MMLDALVSGTRDPEVLAELAQGQLRKKLPALEGALEGHFSSHHALLVGHILAHIDYLEETIAHADRGDRHPVSPLSRTRPSGLTRSTASPSAHRQAILAELGPDMSHFATHRHAASWVSMCPGNHESAGKRRSGRTRKANPYLRAALVEAANAAARTKDTYLRAQYEQVKRRHGHNKAIVAVAHSILIAAYYILRDDVPYQDLGGDYFTRRADPERIARRLIAQLERLGHTVTLAPNVTPTGPS